MTEVILKNGLVDVGAGEFRRTDVVVADARVTIVGDVGLREADSSSTAPG